ncbi:MAG: type IV pilus assembly protein PilM [Patescibacteria group bacterium]
MLSFLKSFFTGNSVLGVDIGTSSIKIAEISKSSEKPKLKNYGILEAQSHLERSNSALQTNSLKLADKETAKLISALVEKSRFKTKNVVASIPSFSSFVTLVEMPKMSNEEVNKTMSYQIRQYIPLPESEVAIDWIKVGESESEGIIKQQILLVSIPNEEIRRYQNIFKLAGLKLKSLEIESMALSRALVFGDLTPTILVDIGAYSTNIAVVENGFLKSNIFTDFAGSSLTQAIANGLGIEMKRAEELKKQKGLKATGGEYQLSTLPQPFLDVIIGEVVRIRENFEAKKSKKIERVLLAGGGANLIGIEEYFEKQTGLPSALGNALLRVDYPKETELFSKELGAELAVAIGLAIK